MCITLGRKGGLGRKEAHRNYGFQISTKEGMTSFPTRACAALIALAFLGYAPYASSQTAPGADANTNADAEANASTNAVLKRFFHDVQQFQADFTQLEFDGDGVFRKESAGRLYLSRPGRFRLDYLEPDELMIWADGENLSMFDKELEQVTVYRQSEQLRESAAALLVGDASVLENYEVNAAEFEDGLQWFDLVSTGAAVAAAAEDGSLRLALRGSAPAVLEYSDDLGSRVRLLLFRLDFDSELDDKLFDPDIPPGVDIFEAVES